MIAGHAAAAPLDGSLPADVAAARVAARAKSDALREDDPFRAEFHTVLAAAEAAVALGIVLNVYHLFESIKPSDVDLMRD